MGRRLSASMHNAGGGNHACTPSCSRRGLACAASSQQRAQAYPSNRVKLIVPFPKRKLVRTSTGASSPTNSARDEQVGGGRRQQAGAGSHRHRGGGEAAPTALHRSSGQTSNPRDRPVAARSCRRPGQGPQSRWCCSAPDPSPSSCARIRRTSRSGPARRRARKQAERSDAATPGNGTVAHLIGVRLQKVAGVKLELSSP